MLSDIEIAHSVKLKPIEQLAHEIGLTDAEFEPYGRDKAKVHLNPERKPHGKLILVTATSTSPVTSTRSPRRTTSSRRSLITAATAIS